MYYRIARNFGGQNFGGFGKNRFWRLIFWRIDAKADIHAHVYPILAVKILAFREQSAKSAKILITKISRYTVLYTTILYSRNALVYNSEQWIDNLTSPEYC